MLRQREMPVMRKYRKVLWTSATMLVCNSVYLFASVLSHDENCLSCRCMLCLNDGISEENEYLYNHYLLLISVFWITALVCLYCGVQLYCMKRN